MTVFVITECDLYSFYLLISFDSYCINNKETVLIIRNKLIYLNCCLFMLFECISTDPKIIAICYDLSLLCNVNVKIFQSWLFNKILYCLIGLINALRVLTKLYMTQCMF